MSVVAAYRRILALLVALLWIGGCAPRDLLGTADERMSQDGNVDALPARRVEAQLPSSSPRDDAKGGPPRTLELPSDPVQAIEPDARSIPRDRTAQHLHSGSPRGPPSSR